jgi:haloalkane dehalogenase
LERPVVDDRPTFERPARSDALERGNCGLRHGALEEAIWYEGVMEIVRTPDERFADLPGWPYQPHYTDVTADDGTVLRIHHVDEGPSDAPPIVCLHGEPSWGFLYRKMIPVFTEAGHRVVVPDLVGFGRSDKPVERADYTYLRHVEWMKAWLEANDIRGATLVGQDWGGLIGLRLVAEQPDRFDRIVAANTFLPTGDRPPGDAFLAWRKYSQEVPDFNVGGIVSGGCVTRPLPAEVVAAYNAPFPDDTYKAGARQFPTLVPISPDDPAAAANIAAWEVLSKWTKPMLCAFSDSDPITAGGDRAFQKLVPGTQGMPHTTLHGAGHFLQEDKGEELAAAIVHFLEATKAAA